jgi:hypothetical protein
MINIYPITATVPGEPIVNIHAPAPTPDYYAPPPLADLYVSVYNGQQHFAYRDADGNIQDIWFDGNEWNLQQLNNANGASKAGVGLNSQPIALPTATVVSSGGLFVSVYNDQQHFFFMDENNNIQDVWYNGHHQWNLQQINHANGIITQQGEYLACSQAPAAQGDMCVAVYNGQHHVCYRDRESNIQDVWWDGHHQWNLQQLNAPNGQTTVTGEFKALPDAPSSFQNLATSAYGNQQHFAYLHEDSYGNATIWDAFWS